MLVKASIGVCATCDVVERWPAKPVFIRRLLDKAQMLLRNAKAFADAQDGFPERKLFDAAF
jgi:hypothetical protein